MSQADQTQQDANTTSATSKETEQTAPVAFAGQILPEQLSIVKEKGFVSVINNRPDGEEPNQPTSEQVEAAARALGLNYVYQPIVGGQMTEYDVESFARHYQELQKPLLMFCRSGNRSSNLYNAAVQMGLI